MELAREFGRTVVDLGFASEEQVQEARREQRLARRVERRRLFLAEVLVNRSLLDPARLVRALEWARGYREADDERSPRLGEIAIAKGYASPLQVYESLIEQRDEVASGATRRPIGEIMLEHCRLAPWELEDVLVTAAELAAGSLRSGATPCEPFLVGPGLYSDEPARSYGRSVVRAVRTTTEPAKALVKDAVAPCARTTPDVRIAEALDLAIDEDAEAILVFHQGELVGTVSAWDARELDPRLPVGRVMERAATLDARSALGDAAALLRERDVPFVAVTSGATVEGVLGRSELRVAGLPLDEPAFELGGSD